MPSPSGSETEQIVTTDNIRVSRTKIHDDPTTYFTVTLIDPVGPLALAILTEYLPYDAVLDEVEAVDELCWHFHFQAPK